MTLDIQELINSIKDTSSEILKKDVATVRGFSNRQLKGIATQSALVATGLATGQIRDSLKDFFLDQIVELVRNFVNTLVGLTLATIERLWNAIVNTIWGAISKATNIPIGTFEPL